MGIEWLVCPTRSRLELSLNNMNLYFAYIYHNKMIDVLVVNVIYLGIHTYPLIFSNGSGLLKKGGSRYVHAIFDLFFLARRTTITIIIG